MPLKPWLLPETFMLAEAPLCIVVGNSCCWPTLSRQESRKMELERMLANKPSR